MKTKLREVSIIKDGGTIVLFDNTDYESIRIPQDVILAKKYYIDNRIGSTTKGDLFGRYPSDKDAIKLNINNFEIIN